MKGDLYSIDIFMVGVANRSVHLVTGFVEAFDRWNIFAAAPLVRLQVDSLLRVSFLARAPDGAAIADEVIKGRSFRSLKDPDGHQLSDARLLTLALPHHPWLKDVYKSGNEWIHLSTIQVMAPWEYSKEGGPAGKLTLQFPMRRAAIPAGFLTNMLAAMTEATDDVLTYLEIWRKRKGLPSGEARE